jgi:hypothetical protein
MVELPPLLVPENGQLSDNIAHFARAMRKVPLTPVPERL